MNRLPPHLVLVLSFLVLTACAITPPTPTPAPTTVPTPTPVPSTVEGLVPSTVEGLVPSTVEGRITATPAPVLSVTILPDAEQTYKLVSGRAPFSVTFTAQVTGGAAPYTYEWDFDGDNQPDTAAAAPPPHVYEMPRAYNAALRVKDASGQETRAVRRIVAFAPPQMPAWKYGITAHLERRHPPYYPTLDDVTHAAQLMQDAGVQAVRMDFNWDMLNPRRDEWKFEDYDNVVKIVRAHDMEFLGILDYVSWWASSAQDSNDWRVRLYSEPSNNYDFAHYTYEVVSHFKQDIHVWQIWNEPNTEGFWKPKPNPARYVELLQEAYLAAKYADPDAVVLFAGLSSNGIEGNDDSGLTSNFVAQAYAAGARGYFDAMAIHPYMLPNGGIESLRGKISATRALMDENGDTEIPLWLTEIGVPSEIPWWSTAPPQSEAEVASWLKLVYTNLWDLTPTIFWYQLQDREIENAEGRFGILRSDYSAKPAYDTLKTITGGGK